MSTENNVYNIFKLSQFGKKPISEDLYIKRLYNLIVSPTDSLICAAEECLRYAQLNIKWQGFVHIPSDIIFKICDRYNISNPSDINKMLCCFVEVKNISSEFDIQMNLDFTINPLILNEFHILENSDKRQRYMETKFYSSNTTMVYKIAKLISCLSLNNVFRKEFLDIMDKPQYRKVFYNKYNFISLTFSNFRNLFIDKFYIDDKVSNYEYEDVNTQLDQFMNGIYDKIKTFDEHDIVLCIDRKHKYMYFNAHGTEGVKVSTVFHYGELTPSEIIEKYRSICTDKNLMYFIL